ncbi:MAG: hypothetical protein PHS79_04990 [Patescibacteria group bacterium]|nr:hypothetical protein [Patescibacteria group bacterium]
MALSEISRQFFIIHENARHRDLPGLDYLDSVLIEMIGMEPNNLAWSHTRQMLADAAKAVVRHDLIAAGPHVHARRALIMLSFPRGEDTKRTKHLIAQLAAAINASTERERNHVSVSTIVPALAPASKPHVSAQPSPSLVAVN